MTEPRSAGAPAPLPATTEGTDRGSFGALDWALATSAALIWGSSFLFIAVGLDHFEPGLVTLLRVFFGAVAMNLVPAARQPIDPADRPRVLVLSVLWLAVPLTLFPVAQQWVDSSVAGMINGATPLFAGLVASLLLRRLPGRAQAVGLVLGFLGVVAISIPSLGGADASPLGIGLLLAAITCYGISINLAVPLNQKYGGPAATRAILTLAVPFVVPYGLWGAGDSSFAWSALAAMVALGALGTGLAFVAVAALSGRVGGTRGAVPVYFTPVVAIVLGAVVRDETVAGVAVVGTALVLLGAWLVSRSELG